MKNDHLTPRAAPIGPGDPAPRFTLLDQNRDEWSLADHLGRGDVVLCFYPLDFTSVCGDEMSCLTAEMDRFRDRGAVAVGISCDSFAAHKAWADQLGLAHTLLADMHRHVCRAYGFYWDELNVASRGTVVIAPDGVVRWAQSREPGSAMDLGDVLGATAR